MALSSASVWEVRPTNGSDTNGGGFVRGAAGTDFSTQNAKNSSGNNISTTDVVATGVATITSATASFTSVIVGNIIYLSGSGITTGWYQVATYTNGTTVILDRSPGTGTGVTMNIGGALQTLGQLNTNMANGHSAWVKAEATITTATAINFSFTSNSQSFVAGYTSTRGDGGQVTIQATTTSFTIVQIQNNNNLNTFTLRNFILDCNSESTVIGIATQSYGNTLENITVKNYNAANTAAFDISQGGSQGIVLRKCLAISGGGTNPIGFKIAANLLGTTLIDCQCLSQSGGVGFLIAGATCIRCIAGNISGASADGWQLQGDQAPTILEGTVAYKCGRDGVRFLSNAFVNYGVSIQNHVSYGNGGWDFDNTLTAIPAGGIYLDYSATGGSTSGAATGVTLGPNCVTLGSDPFVNGTANNFAPA
jgi:hypothetical protein